MILWAYNLSLGIANACTASTLIVAYNNSGKTSAAFWVALIAMAVSLALMAVVNIRELWWKPRKAKKEKL